MFPWKRGKKRGRGKGILPGPVHMWSNKPNPNLNSAVKKQLEVQKMLHYFVAMTADRKQDRKMEVGQVKGSLLQPKDCIKTAAGK